MSRRLSLHIPNRFQLAPPIFTVLQCTTMQYCAGNHSLVVSSIVCFWELVPWQLYNATIDRVMHFCDFSMQSGQFKSAVHFSEQCAEHCKMNCIMQCIVERRKVHCIVVVRLFQMHCTAVQEWIPGLGPALCLPPIR